MMEPKIKYDWLIALRSGKFQQGRQYLKDNDGNYCCLGVLCEIQNINIEEKFLVIEKEDDEGYTYPCLDNREISVLQFEFAAGLSEDEMELLAQMNDGGGDFNGDPQSFLQIADYIEQKL